MAIGLFRSRRDRQRGIGRKVTEIMAEKDYNEIEAERKAKREREEAQRAARR